MAKVVTVIAVLLPGIICHVLSQISFQPYGPKMCRLLCKQVNCTATRFEEAQLVCRISTKTYTTKFYSYTSKREKDTTLNSPINVTRKGKKIKKYSKRDRTPNADDRKLLQIACKKGDLSAVRKLVGKSRVDIACRKYDEHTPVMIAAKFKRTKIFDFLVQQGCDLSAMKNHGSSVLHFACIGGAQDIVRKLLDNHHSWIECRNRKGFTPVMFAVQEGHIIVVKILIKHKADMRKVNYQAWNVFHLACFSGGIDMVKFLFTLRELRGLERKKTRHGKTAIGIAQSNRHRQIESYLKTKLYSNQIHNFNRNRRLHFFRNL